VRAVNAQKQFVALTAEEKNLRRKGLTKSRTEAETLTLSPASMHRLTENAGFFTAELFL
jgi:hypothetical protein